MAPVSRLPISPRRLRWLRGQTDLWIRDGVIPAPDAERILGAYDTDSIAARRARMLFLTLCGLALLMFSAGVLLLIGYNWNAIPRGAKVAVIFAAVVAAFIGSAAAYARARQVAGELLAFVGTLFYGNAIWLLAQVFHIEAHYPDGVMWWAFGALAVAHALSSRMIGHEAIILLAVWTTMETGWFASPHYFFLPALAAAIWLALRLDAASLAATASLTGTLWLLVVTANAWNAEALFASMATLAGCALYASGEAGIARWPARPVQFIGLLVLLTGLLTGTFTSHHRTLRPWTAVADVTPVLIAAVLLFAFVFTVLVRRRRGSGSRSLPIVLAAVAALVPMTRGTLWHFEPPADELILAGLFSAASLIVGIWLILMGVRQDRAWSFFGGVCYVLLFVLVRWMDLIGDMLSSAAIFFAAAFILMGTAHYGRKRARRAVPAGGGNA